VVDKNDDETYELRYTNRQQGIENRVLGSGPIASLKTPAVPGAYLRLSGEFLAAPYSFEFSVVPLRLAVDRVLYSLSVDGPRRDQEYISVSYRGRDYQLITETVNAIADHYVEQNLDFRKRRTQEALRVLEKQLRKAEEQLAVSEAGLRSFLSANPNVALSAGAQQTITEIMNLEASTHQSSSAASEAERLMEEYANAPAERRQSYISEIAIFLQTNGVASAQVLQAELQQLLRERTQLEQDFAPNHPAVRENRQKIDALGKRAAASLSNFIQSTRERLEYRRSGISRLTSRLNALPTKELQLAELRRKQEIDSEIYSTVLARYNEVKVADAVETADVFVMDYAVPPYPPSFFQRASMLLALCLYAGVAVSLAPPVLVDLVDKTARTEKELEKMSDLPVLETIPTIPSTKRGDT
jgi:uncharacterized protein involved in exopolysaccharide biosynthesis